MSKPSVSIVHPEDLDAVRVAFGTFADFVTGRGAVEHSQWRDIWPRISDCHMSLFRGVPSVSHGRTPA